MTTKTGNLAIVTMASLFILAAVGWYVHWVAGAYLATSLKFLIQACALAASAALVITLAAFGWIAFERARLESERRQQATVGRRSLEAEVMVKQATAQKTLAEALKLRREAEIFATVTKPGELLHITHTGLTDTKTVIPTLAGTTHVNGKPLQPSTDDLQRWYFIQGRGLDRGQNQLVAPPLTPLLGPPQVEALLPERVDLLDLLLNQQGNLRQIVLGVTLDKATGKLRTVTAPIWQLVHIANAGATDSGKSNMARCLAYQVATARNTQMVMVDLKRTTFKPFSYSDRLIYPLVTSVEEFGAVIGELLGEVQRRLRLFERDITIETIHDYNLKAEEPLPYLVIFIDEISNIFRDKATQELFFNVISMSRAAGIYFVCAGQTWSYRTMQTSIRQQFRTGLHFATNDAASSRMILNDSRATEIELQGRAYATLPFGLEKDIVELQTPYLTLETVVQTLPQTEQPMAVTWPQPQPTEQEQTILDLYQEGASHAQICKQVWGYKSSNKYPEIDAVLEKFSTL
jgi:hypothetical protein